MLLGASVFSQWIFSSWTYEQYYVQYTSHTLTHEISISQLLYGYGFFWSTTFLCALRPPQYKARAHRKQLLISRILLPAIFIHILKQMITDRRWWPNCTWKGSCCMGVYFAIRVTNRTLDSEGFGLALLMTVRNCFTFLEVRSSENPNMS